MNRTIRRSAVLAAFSIVIASCGGSSSSTTTEAAPSTEAPSTTDETTAPAPTGPEVTIVEGTEFPASGATVTVKGTGFTDLALGTRPPLEGQPTGLYIVFGTFDDAWKPSEGAPASSRRTVAEDQMWVMPAASRSILDPQNLLPNVFTLEEDGSFTVTIPVSKIDGTGTYAIAVYPASGAIKAEHEFLIPITFA